MEITHGDNILVTPNTTDQKKKDQHSHRYHQV